MRARSLAATAVTAALGLSSLAPAHAVVRKPALPKALVFTDVTGDANGINGQDADAPVPSQSTPAQADGFDIKSVSLVTDKAGAAATKILATLELKAAPFASAVYRIEGSLNGSCFSTELDTSPNDVLTTASVRICDDTVQGFTDYTVSAKVTGSKIVWTIPIKQFKTSGLKVGAVIDSLGADARLLLGLVTEPSIDKASSDASYKVGQ